MAEPQSTEDPSLEDSSISSISSEQGHKDQTKRLDTDKNPSDDSEESALASKSSGSEQISVESGVENAGNRPKSPVPISSVCIEEIKDDTLSHSSTFGASSIASEIPDDSVRILNAAQPAFQKIRRRVCYLTKKFSALRRQATSIEPMPELIDDQDVEFDEILERPTRLNLAADAEPTSSKSSEDNRSRSSFASSEDSHPEYRVDACEDSSSSLDKNISNLDIADEKPGPSIKISPIGAHPKRKHESPVMSVPDCSRRSSKKVRPVDEIIKVYGSNVAIEGFPDDSQLFYGTMEDSNASGDDFGTENTDNPQPSSSDNASEPMTTSDVVQEPIVQFPDEEAESSLRSKRIPLKRTQVMSPKSVEDITDEPSDPKKKKQED